MKLIVLHDSTYLALRALRDCEGGTMDTTVGNLLLLHGVPDEKILAFPQREDK